MQKNITRIDVADYKILEKMSGYNTEKIKMFSSETVNKIMLDIYEKEIQQFTKDDLVKAYSDYDFKDSIPDKLPAFDENGKMELITQKGGKTPCSLRYIPMTSKARWCLIELKQLSKGSTYVISDSNGDQVNPTNLYQCFNRLLKNSGIIGVLSGV